MRGGTDKLPPTSYDCHCRLTTPFFTRKSMVKISVFVSFRAREHEGTERDTEGVGCDMS